MTNEATFGSREAAKECSPRRKPWIKPETARAPKGRKRRHTVVRNADVTSMADSRQLTAAPSHLLPRLPQRNLHIHFLLTPIDGDSHAVAGTMVVHHLRQVLLVLNLLAIDSHNQVSSQHDGDVAQVRALGPATESSLIRRAAGSDLHNQQTI